MRAAVLFRQYLLHFGGQLLDKLHVLRNSEQRILRKYLLRRDGIGMLTFVGVVILDQELAVAVLDDGLGVALDLVYHAEDLSDLGVERSSSTSIMTALSTVG